MYAEAESKIHFALMGCGKGANEMIAFEAESIAIELLGKYPYSGIQGFLDNFIQYQVVGFIHPAQSSVQERLKLLLMGVSQVAPYGYRIGNHRHHIDVYKRQVL